MDAEHLQRVARRDRGIRDAEELGDTTLFRLDIRGQGAGSEIPLEWTVWQAAKWRGGKVYWWASFNTRAEALKAIQKCE
jgi:hypothetical protein